MALCSRVRSTLIYPFAINLDTGSQQQVLMPYVIWVAACSDWQTVLSAIKDGNIECGSLPRVLLPYMTSRCWIAWDMAERIPQVINKDTMLLYWQLQVLAKTPKREHQAFFPFFIFCSWFCLVGWHIRYGSQLSSSPFSSLLVLTSRLPVDSRVSDPALVSFFITFQMIAWIGLSIVLMTAWFSPNIQRLSTWYSFCVSWILYGISYSIVWV